MTELDQFETKCGRCKAIVQRLRNLLDKVKAIKENEIVGICEHCKQTSSTKIRCKRCDFIASKFISMDEKRRKERRECFKVWLYKVKHLLLAILDGESVCQYVLHRDTELERILHELYEIKQPLNIREPDIDYFPSLVTSLQSVSESKEVYEKLLPKFTPGKRFASDDSLYPSPSKEMCLCKYLKERRDTGADLFNKVIPGLGLEKTKDSNSPILAGEPTKNLCKLLSQDIISKKVQKDIVKTKRDKNKTSVLKKKDEKITPKKVEEKKNVVKTKSISSESTTKEGKIKDVNEVVESELLKLSDNNKGNAENILKEKILARDKESEKKRSGVLALKKKHSPKKKNIASPSITSGGSIILECGTKTTSEPKIMVNGEKMTSFKQTEEVKEPEPMLFMAQYNFGEDSLIEHNPKYQPINKSVGIFKGGVMKYELSNRDFIDKGVTILPTQKIMRKMNIYRMEPANPQNDWFQRHKLHDELFYDSGDKLAYIDSDGRGHWYYKSGSIALDYYNAQESQVGQRYVVYSSGTEIMNGKKTPRTVLGVFDVLGNGVVYDHYGKVRLKFNQSEGLVVDPKVGPPGRWKWHTLNEPPVLLKVLIDTSLKERDHKLESLRKGCEVTDKVRELHPDMLAIELGNCDKEKKVKLMQEFKPFKIRMKAFKLNEQFSLKILDQSNIHLLFRDGRTNLKLNLGMILRSDEIIDTDTSNLGAVSTPYDIRPARSHSIENIQRILKAVRTSK